MEVLQDDKHLAACICLSILCKLLMAPISNDYVVLFRDSEKEPSPDSLSWALPIKTME